MRFNKLLRVAVAFAVLMGFSFAAVRGESTIQCPSGKIDTVDWLTLDADLRSTKHMVGGHDLYTHLWPDKIWWIKEPSGRTWDILRYDGSNVMFYITNLEWANPRHFSEHTTAVPLAPRCATPGYPGTARQHPNTDLNLWNQCSVTSATNVGPAVTEVWGPYTAGNPGLDPRPPIGGDIPNNTPVYTFSWRWGCNQFYGACAIKEEFVTAQRYGLVQWSAYRWENGGYVLDARSNFNRLVNGNVNPIFPCF